MIPKPPRMILQPKPDDSETKTDDSATKNDSETKKNGFWNQGWFRNQGHLETKMAWFSNEAVCISFFFEASSWLCHLGTCLTLLSHPTPPHRIWRRCHAECGHKCVEGRNAAARTLLSDYYPTPPHPPRIRRRCHVECGCKCVKGRNAAARTLLSHPTPPHPRASETMPCWVWLQVSVEGTQLPGRHYPTPPHPTPPHPETMPCWVWLQVCQRKERSCQDVIIPPHPTPLHLETMPCWVWLQVCQRKERSCQDVIIPPHPTPPHPTVSGESHPTPPHPPASGDDAMLSVAASVSKEGTQLPGRYYPTPPHRIWRWCHVECGRKCVKGRNAAARTLFHPTPPHPPASGDDAMLTVAASVTRMLVSESRGWWLRNRLFLVAKSLCFGCGIAFFWLRNRLFCGCGIVSFWLRKRLFLVAESSFLWLRNRFFLVAEAPFLGCGSVSDFGCGIAEIWLRKRRNMVSESEFILPARAPAKGLCSGTL